MHLYTLNHLNKWSDVLWDFWNAMNSEALGFQYPRTCRDPWRPSLLGHTKSSPFLPLVNQHVPIFQMAMITIWDQPMLRQNHIKISWIRKTLMNYSSQSNYTFSRSYPHLITIRSGSRLHHHSHSTNPTEHRRRAHRRVPPPSHSLPRGAEAQVFADLCKVLTLR